MTAPSFTLAAIWKLGPCADRFAAAKAVLPQRGRITAAMAREVGISFGEIVWAVRTFAPADKDVERRMRLWLADCAARVLHIYEKTETSDAPRDAIVTARQYARGEAVDRAAASDAAFSDAMAAGWTSPYAPAWAAASAASSADDSDAVRTASTAANLAGDGAAAEKAWQFDRLIAWFSDDEPTDFPLPIREAKAA